ncbi:ECF RNA polymerase sigma factor SigK [Nocardia huaxiensis]|uniref:ECF RNA polymerase sigma factor SigK n=1 Tax=Nocardia huaxiensis TaxID=2755382 RepID=UPI001E435FE4|nr:ECF RNA polymerase sigma factor SigK [Nocardia huaxiensis]UFS98023.1 ECF RNA polymerase sigma factor SigK [Nocardia huaxiensis]
MVDEHRFQVVGAGEPVECVVDEPAACPAARPAPDAAAVRRLEDQLAGIAAGDREAFTRFYRETQRRTFGLALRVVRQSAAAEDVTQEVYLQVWHMAGRYDRRMASPMGWLMMLTHRRAVDRVRAESSSTARDLAYGQRNLGRDHDIVAEIAGQHAEERAVTDCLGTLTALQRETVALTYYGGRTYSEVADQLGVPLSTVKTRIRDGLQRLRNCLTGSVTDA